MSRHSTRRTTTVPQLASAAAAMFALPTTSAQDLAMKLIIVLGNGDYEIEQDFIESEFRPLIAALANAN